MSTVAPVVAVTGGASGIGAAVVDGADRPRVRRRPALDLRLAPAAAHSVAGRCLRCGRGGARGGARSRSGSDRSARVRHRSPGYYEMVPVAQISPERGGGCCACTLGGLVNVCAGDAARHARAPRAARSWPSPANWPSAAATETRTTPRPRAPILGLVRSLAAEVAPAGGAGQRGGPRARRTPRCSAADSPWRAAGLPRHAAAAAAGHPARRSPAASNSWSWTGTFSVGEVVNVNSGAVI